MKNPFRTRVGHLLCVFYGLLLPKCGQLMLHQKLE